MSSESTRILTRVRDGDARAAKELMTLVYDEIRRLAAGHLANERPNHTLQPTALVHEAFLRMVDQSNVDWQGRAHFFAVAAQMIRRVLVDHARARAAAKRGGGAVRLDLTESLSANEAEIDFIALNEALDELAELNDRHRQIVELRYFAGMTLDEVAEALGVSRETIKVGWRTARAWLRSRLDDDVGE